MFLFGCRTTQHRTQELKSQETPQDIQSAVGTVVDSVRGKKRIVKYCPLCGKHYSANLTACLVDGTALKEVEE